MSKPPRGIRQLLAEADIVELEFVQHRDTRTVHVVTPEDPDVEPEVGTPEGDDAKLDVVLSLVRSVKPTICGYVAHVYMDPTRHSDNIIDEFEDELLCGRCHRVLGEHSNRAFEHPTPRKEEDQ
jgi:hypothetical protein